VRQKVLSRDLRDQHLDPHTQKQHHHQHAAAVETELLHTPIFFIVNELCQVLKACVMPPKRRVFLKLYLSHVARGETRMQPCPGDEEIFQEVVASMAAHDENSRLDLQRWMHDFSLISEEHKRVLQRSMDATFDGVARAIVVNQQLLDAIVALVDEKFVPSAHPEGDVEGHQTGHEHGHRHHHQRQPPLRIGGVINHDKCAGTLRQFAREWSSLCAHERQTSFGPMLMHLNAAHGGLDAAQRARVRVLVPGSGLGRLMWEICKCGFSCEGNEFSYHMLLGCSFALNHFTQTNEFLIQPWAGGVSNHVTLADRLMQVQLPDEIPCLPDENVRMSMVAGEFCEVYNGMISMFDVVCTSFFVDTAPNALDYISTIHTTLKDGGMWINNGPLMSICLCPSLPHLLPRFATGITLRAAAKPTSGRGLACT
jgi:hypothetical protein